MENKGERGGGGGRRRRRRRIENEGWGEGEMSSDSVAPLVDLSGAGNCGGMWSLPWLKKPQRHA